MVSILVIALWTAGEAGLPSAWAAPTATPSAVVDTFPPAVRTQLQSVVTVARDRYHIPGVTVWVSVPGEGFWEGAYGYADLHAARPLTLGAHLPIGSVTKTFTATVILKLVEERRLSLSAPISRWVPQVQDARRITVRMLLDMTSGIYDEFRSGSRLLAAVRAHPRVMVTPAAIVRLAVAHGPVGPPGTAYYSSTNYVILGMIAQDMTRRPIGSLITSEILAPLHLDGTTFAASDSLPSPSALDYTIEGRTATEDRLYPLSAVGAAGGMVSTVSDMARWAQALGTGQFLSPSVEKQRLEFGPILGSFTPLPTSGRPAASLPVRYGLGLFELGSMLGHNGELDGYVDDVVYAPSRHATIVVFANGINPTAIPDETPADAMTVSIADAVLHKPSR